MTPDTLKLAKEMAWKFIQYSNPKRAKQFEFIESPEDYFWHTQFRKSKKGWRGLAEYVQEREKK